MGAILINGDSDFGSFSSAKRFEIINLQNKVQQLEDRLIKLEESNE